MTFSSKASKFGWSWAENSKFHSTNHRNHLSEIHKNPLNVYFCRMAATVSEIMSSALFHQLMFCAITTAILVVAIDMNNLFTLTTVISIEGVLCTITPTFVFCNLSESITSELLAIGDTFYECGWYRLPVDQQKRILLPLRRSQKELRMTGLGMMDCSLQVFIKVSKYSLKD